MFYKAKRTTIVKLGQYMYLQYIIYYLINSNTYMYLFT